MHFLWGLCCLIVFVLDIIAIIDCIQRNMETSKKILWCILIIVLPLIGMILYFLLGKSK